MLVCIVSRGLGTEMARIRAFNDDEGQVILIPADMAYADMEMELEITRSGDVIIICPAYDRPKGAAETPLKSSGTP